MTGYDLRMRESEVGDRDFMFGTTGVLLMVLIALLFVVFS